MSEIRGTVAPGFEPVREVFEENFAAGEELGAGFAAILDGEIVVDLMGGYADRKKDAPWDENTIVPVYSTTKGIAALVIASAIGALEDGYETRVSAIWPEFSAGGKGDVTIAEMLSHQAGLCGFKDPIDPALWLDPPALAAALAELEPLWEPGTAHGYHPLSWGYLAGEIVQRISGRSLGTILREDFCTPNGIDFQIGLPTEDHERVAEIMRPREMPQLGDINEFKKVAFLTKWASPDRGGAIWREIEIPSANGHGSAKSVAQLYGIYANQGTLGGKTLIPEESFSALTRRRVMGEDLVLPFVTEFASGVMRNNLGIYGPNPETLAHSGWGGSLALGDPDRHLSAAYVMNRQSSFLQGDPRARRLVDALYGCL
ncbi:class A beta-lactamase-related serine hydrolase [Henriciella mobilis]|uniref:serine hydrolase domain-containing protein n=1 Tax=Henriciella mobilis TaxID=2305467 RepID=UPI000E67556E|nr:serine hydrolase domain-containing protein [Henriciella mobilis]RIJ17857.1 class A beta-lactamase-related serine hydrolase [Henriciella mobilis]RIJ25331.1 class A beta-lactamase-related serine hydrolase [Henriciella mobilis]